MSKDKKLSEEELDNVTGGCDGNGWKRTCPHCGSENVEATWGDRYDSEWKCNECQTTWMERPTGTIDEETIVIGGNAENSTSNGLVK